MSIATLSARVHARTPEDELIGSLSRERVTLLVQEAGNRTRAEGLMAAKCWLAYALNCDIPANSFDTLASAFEQAEQVRDCDLLFWYDVENTEANRHELQHGADVAVDVCVAALADRLCAQLGVS